MAGITINRDYILVKNEHGVKLYYPNTLLGPLKKRPRKTATEASALAHRFNHRYKRLLGAQIRRATPLSKEQQ